MFHKLDVRCDDANTLDPGSSEKSFWWVNVRNVLVHQGGGVRFEELIQAEHTLFTLVGRVLLRTFGFGIDEQLHQVDRDVVDVRSVERYQVFDDALADVLTLDEISPASIVPTTQLLTISSQDSWWEGKRATVRSAHFHYTYPIGWFLRVEVDLHENDDSLHQGKGTLSVRMYGDAESEVGWVLHEIDPETERVIETWRGAPNSGPELKERSTNPLCVVGEVEMLMSNTDISSTSGGSNDLDGSSVRLCLDFRTC